VEGQRALGDERGRRPKGPRDLDCGLRNTYFRCELDGRVGNWPVGGHTHTQHKIKMKDFLEDEQTTRPLFRAMFHEGECVGSSYHSCRGGAAPISWLRAVAAPDWPVWLRWAFAWGERLGEHWLCRMVSVL
jgi:hypothetical protein